jgi:hypothetical protein
VLKCTPLYFDFNHLSFKRVERKKLCLAPPTLKRSA